MDYARQNSNNNNNKNTDNDTAMNNSQNKYKPVTRPAIPAKPANLNFKIKKDNNESNTKTPLSRMSSLTHMTPKIWIKSETKQQNTVKNEVKTNQDLPVKSPFEKKWRPAPQLNLCKTKTSSVSVPVPKTMTNIRKNNLDNVNESKEPKEENNKILSKTSDIKGSDSSTSKNNLDDVNKNKEPKEENNKILSKTSDNKKLVSSTSKNNLAVRSVGKAINRQSMRRNPKSPGFDTIKKMFDVKRDDTITTKPKLKLSNSNQWQHVSSPRNRSSSNTDTIQLQKEEIGKSLNTQNIFKYDDCSILMQQNNSNEHVRLFNTKEDHEDQYQMNEDLSSESIESIVCSQRQQSVNEDSTDNIDQNNCPEATSVNKYTLNKISNQDHYSIGEDFHPPTGIYESLDDSSTDSSDSTQRFPRVPTYYDFEEFDNESTTGVYEVGEISDSLGDMVVEPPSVDFEQRQEYLPMTGSNLKSAPSIKYVEMKSKSDIDEKYPVINYSTQVVSAPSNVKPKREYHTIDSIDVPAPPDRAPPRLPLLEKSNKGTSSSQPPPLPPDNTFGRRSKMYSKNKQKLIVAGLKERVKNNQPGQADVKLNYIEVDVSQNNSSSPLSIPQKTNYSDVVILSDNEFQRTRNRSGSATSEEGLSSTTKKKSAKKKSHFQLFAPKENQGLDSSSTVKEDNEVLSDFGKERNKKIRISERFLGKKNKKNKKKRDSDDWHSKSFESDSGTYDVETITSEPSGNTSGISGGSLQSSGDGEVQTNMLSHLTANPVNQVCRQKSEEIIARNPPLPKPRSTFKTSNQLPDHQDKILEKNDAPKVQSFLHGSPKTAIKREKSLPHLSSDTELPPRNQNLSSIDSSSPFHPSSPPHDISSSSGLHSSDNIPNTSPQKVLSNYPTESPDILTLVTPHRDAVPPLVIRSEADHVSYDMADDVPPPLPERDDQIHPLNVVPPSPYTESDELGSSKFLNSEPLYQIYRDRTLSCASMARRTKGKTKRGQSVPEWKSEFMSEDLGTSTLWRHIPEVEGSSFIQEMNSLEIKLQQAQFEVLTSQASYLRSLNILVEHFMNDWAMQSQDYLPLKDRRHLFSNIETVQSIEKRFLQDLEKHFWSDLYLTKICDFVAKYAMSDFNVYALYIQNQVYQDRVLTKLQRTNDNFGAELCRLESSPVCNKLPLLSFLMLPMQRVTRLPLLVSAIIKAADSANNREVCLKAKYTLGVVNKLVKKCNESARKMQQTEQLAEIASQIDYSLSIRTFALVSQSRSLIKKGEMALSMVTDKKVTKSSKLWLFLFTDVLFIARKKSYLEVGNSNPRFEVIDWCKRSTICVNEKAVQENCIFLILLENQAGKRVEITLNPVAQNELSRWGKALSPPTPAGEGESIYESWDCPQFVCVEPYEREQPDELSIDVDDVMQVLKKTSDGWLEGERLRDGETGWFPITNCKEIDDEHVRIRNMKNLYKTGLV